MVKDNKKEIIKRLQKTCAGCGKKIKVILHRDKSYRGGHYFGQIPLCTKKEERRVLKLGTRKVKFGKFIFEVLKEDPKPYGYAEYWECPQCYWGNK